MSHSRQTHLHSFFYSIVTTSQPSSFDCGTTLSFYLIIFNRNKARTTVIDLTIKEKYFIRIVVQIDAKLHNKIE